MAARRLGHPSAGPFCSVIEPPPIAIATRSSSNMPLALGPAEPGLLLTRPGGLAEGNTSLSGRARKAWKSRSQW